VRRRGLFRYFSLVGLAYAVATLGAGLTSYLTTLKLSNTANLMVSSGVGLVTAMALGAIDLAKGKDEPAAPPVPERAGGYPGGGYPGGGYPPYQGYPPPHGLPRSPTPRRRSRVGLALTAVVLLAVCIGGGFGLTSGVTWAVDKVSDLVTPPWLNKTKDPGVERLARVVSATAGPLTLTVQSVHVNDKVTMVDVKAVNTGTDNLMLPTFGNAVLTTADASFKADPHAGVDSITASPGGTPGFGKIVFDGVLNPGAAEVTLTFGQIFGSLRGPQTISVKIPIT
jgi:hypothetical protein